MHDEITKFCPNCKPVYVFKRNPSYYREETQIGVMLEVTSSNYSGCGVDICVCPKCNQKFQVSYKIDEIQQIDKI